MHVKLLLVVVTLSGVFADVLKSKPSRKKESLSIHFPSSSTNTASSASTSSSTTSSSTSTSTSTSSTAPCDKEEELCNIDVAANLNFRDRVPAFGDAGAWTYFAIGDYVANDGTLSFGPNGGYLNAQKYTLYAPQNPIFFLNDPKYLALAKVPLTIPADGTATFEMCLSAQIFGLDNPKKIPFPDTAIASNDPRQGWAGLLTTDLSTGISNLIQLTNDRIYAVSERVPFPGTTYASFGYGFALKKRQPEDVHQVSIVYDGKLRQVRFIIDGELLLTLENLGLYRNSDDYLVYDNGGIPGDVFPTSVSYGFGVGDQLSNYPWCKQPIRECAPYDWTRCDYPRVPSGLVKTGTPPMYSPLFGQPFNASFVDPFASPSSLIYGQGATMHLQRFAAYNKACQQ